MFIPFQTCRERIARAEVHRQSTTDIWNSLNKVENYTGSVKFNDEGVGEFFVTPTNTEWLSPFALEFGEMLYQLRGALDSCVYDAAILKFGQDPPPDEQTWSFPIAATKQGFDNLAGRMKSLPEDIRILIESVQRHKELLIRSNELGLTWQMGSSLELLNDWARIDRHRKLHVVGTLPIDGDLEIVLPEGLTLESCVYTYEATLEEQSKIATFKISGFTTGADIRVNPEFTFAIAINETPIFGYLPEQSLNARALGIFHSVQRVQELFEEHFGLR